jgi:phospholipid/cholesterol/gamma-HCH transport system substrate-binding protein
MAFLGRGPKGAANATTLRKDQRGASPVRVGLLVLAVVAVGTYFGFAKDLPFRQGFRMQAVFEQANSIRPNSPVRIAGVNVGKVKEIKREPGTDMAVVVMEIKEKGLPIHKDATLKIRPRIFLEGNFFVDVKPGTPAAPALKDGDTVSVAQTATPVQLDQVLTALQSDTREDLKAFLEGYGTALTHEPTASEDAISDPDVRGETAATSLNDAARTGARALRGGAIVNQALLGDGPHDLSKLIAGLDKVSRSLGRNEGQLSDLITNFNTTMASFASQKDDLRATVRQLAPTLQQANSTLTHLNSSFPATRAFAREILPGVRETPATIEASFPWLRQTRGLLSSSELGGLTRELSPAISNLSSVTDTSLRLLPAADRFAKCVSRVLLPTGDVKIKDGNFSSGAENYKEFWYSVVGLAGEGQNFDGNGQYVRFQVGGGPNTIKTGPYGGPAGSQLFGALPVKPQGTRPAFPGKLPPKRTDVPCYTSKLPNLNGARTGPPEGPNGAKAAGARP